ncbi:MAG: hypothetical protein KAR11_07205 [Phycisphaerae bacterium]|nr:hypothetical protein [Phycisphaerae bacterium]
MTLGSRQAGRIFGRVAMIGVRRNDVHFSIISRKGDICYVRYALLKGIYERRLLDGPSIVFA